MNRKSIFPLAFLLLGLLASCKNVETEYEEKKVFVCTSCYREEKGYSSMWQRLGKPKSCGHGYMDSETYQGIRLVRRD